MYVYPTLSYIFILKKIKKIYINYKKFKVYNKKY